MKNVPQLWHNHLRFLTSVAINPCKCQRVYDVSYKTLCIQNQYICKTSVIDSVLKTLFKQKSACKLYSYVHLQISVFLLDVLDIFNGGFFFFEYHIRTVSAALGDLTHATFVSVKPCALLVELYG